MTRWVPGSRAVRLVAAVVVVAVAAAVLIYSPLLHSRGNKVVAYFTRSTGLYTGDDVRVLGVRVGTVESITPQGTRVKVVLDVGNQKIPAEAKAAIVAPSLVSGRFVQLAPAYVSGPTLADGGSIPLDRTAVPVEFDEIKSELTELAKALGPSGVGGPNGSLNRLIEVAQKNLAGGTAGNLKVSIVSLSKAAQTLSDNRGDLFATIRNLNSFIHNLVVNDAALRQFSGQLTTFSTTLADNRGQLATAVDSLDQALKLVTTFVRSNTGRLSTTVTSLNEVARTVAQKNNLLATILQNGPFSVDDLYNTIERQAVTGRVSFNNLQNVAELLCGAILGSNGTEADCQTALGPLLKLLGVTSLPGVPGVPVGTSTPTQTPTTPTTGGGGDLLSTTTGVLAGTVGSAQQTVTGLAGLLVPGGTK